MERIMVNRWLWRYPIFGQNPLHLVLSGPPPWRSREKENPTPHPAWTWALAGRTVTAHTLHCCSLHSCCPKNSWKAIFADLMSRNLQQKCHLSLSLRCAREVNVNVKQTHKQHKWHHPTHVPESADPGGRPPRQPPIQLGTRCGS